MSSRESITMWPFRCADGGFIARQTRIRLTASGLPQLVAMEGESPKSGEPSFAVVSEIPEFRGELRSKTQQEVGDVESYLAACSVSGANVSAGLVANDPPDCVVAIGPRKINVETAQIMLPAVGGSPNGIGREYLFGYLREYLLRNSGKLSSRFRQHRGKLVTIWFGSDRSSRLPPVRSDFDKIVEHLTRATPSEFTSPPGFRFRAGETIQSMDAMACNEDNTIGCTWTPLPQEHETTFMRMLGFDLALAYYETYSRSSLRVELRRIVEQHDDARSDVFLVAVNAVTRPGLYFPSGSLLADWLFDDPDPLIGWSPADLPAVVLHDAERGRSRWIHGVAPW